MTQASLDVVGIGNAIVDVIAHAEDSFLVDHALAKGTMTLIDAAQAEQLHIGDDHRERAGSFEHTQRRFAILGDTAFPLREYDD